MDIDDPSQYDKDPLDDLRLVGEALDLYAAGGNAPYAFGDGEVAEVWVVPAREYDELARASSWVLAKAALDSDADDRGTQEQYDEATRAVLHLDEDGPELGVLELIPLDQLTSRLPELIRSLRAHTFLATAIGRANTPEAVILSHEEYAELLDGALRWHQSTLFLESLPVEGHRPTEGSQRFTAESLARSLGPVAEEVWREIQEERARDAGS